MPEIVTIIISSTVTALLTYYFTNKNKQRDINNQKVKELNSILSNMLVGWDYLNKLNLTLKLWEDKSDELVYPKESLSIFLFNSGLLNEKCFEDLEKAVENLKQYDSITYYKLEGIGKKTDFIKKSYIMPFLKARIKTEQTLIISRNFLDKLIGDIEDSLEDVAVLISRKSAKEIKKRIGDVRAMDMGKIIEEVNQEYYYYIVSILPKEFETITYEQFKEGFKKPEMKKFIIEQVDLIADHDMEKLLERFAQNPNMSIEELTATIGA